MPPRRRYMVEPGQRVGRLILIREVQGGRRRRVECLCECGTPTTVLVDSLVSGDTKSCGCLRHDWPGRQPVHGMTHHPLFETWFNMMRRCHNPENPAYRYYGARGIAVCQQWHDVREFVAWIEANLGPRPVGMSLDRVDNDGNYEPGNVRWATQLQQVRNSRTVLRKSLERGT